MGWVDASPVHAARSTWAGRVVGVAAVVDLVSGWDWADVRFVRPAVGHDFVLAWAGLELAVAVACSGEACPHPASVMLLFRIANKPSDLSPIWLVHSLPSSTGRVAFYFYTFGIDDRNK